MTAVLQATSFTRRRWKGEALLPIFPPRAALYPGLTPALSNALLADTGVIIPSSNSYAEFTGETTSSPTITRMTVSQAADAVFIWIGNFPAPSDLGTPVVDMFVTIGSTTHTIKDVTRWSTHMLRATAGEQVKVGFRTFDNSAGVAVEFGIVDGTYLTSTADPTGTTGNANLDYSSPVHWQINNAHITLTSANSTILFNDKGAFFRFMVSESENGTTGWTKPVAITMRAGESFRYRARYRYVALLGFGASQTISVTCAGTISGASNSFVLDDEVAGFVSGNTRLISSTNDGFGGNQGSAGANLEYAVDNASSGDIIWIIENTTYNLTRILGYNASSQKYSKHLSIVCATAATIAGYGVTAPNNSYIWTIEGITFSYASLNTANTLASGLIAVDSGTLWIVRCIVTGPGSGTAKNLVGCTVTGQFYAFGSTFESAGEDVINTSSSTSYAETACCIIRNAGATGDNNENLFTAHFSSVMVDYGSTFTKNSGGGPAVVHANTSYIYLFFSDCQKGTGTSFELGTGSAAVRLCHGITVDQLATDSVITHMVACQITMTLGGIALKPGDGQVFIGNRWIGSASTSGNQMLEPRGNVIIRGNFFDNVRLPIGPNSSISLSGKTWYIEHNTFAANCNAHIAFVSQSVGTLYVRNNIFENCALDIVCPATASGTIISDGNIFGFSVDTDYITRAGSLGAADTNNGTPAINATTKRPSISDTDATHNCDNEGSTGVAGFGYVGADGCGLVNITSERPRGCYGAFSRKLSTTTYHARRWVA